MLFQTAEVSSAVFLPNQNNICLRLYGCFSSNTEEFKINEDDEKSLKVLEIYDLPKIVLQSAKDVVLNNLKLKEERAEKAKFEAKLMEIEAKLWQNEALLKQILEKIWSIM